MSEAADVTTEKMPLPLIGTRVIDMTAVYAGPTCTRILAELGAEVILVEPTYRRGLGLIYPENRPTGEYWNEAGYFIHRNLTKKGITLNLSRPQGREIFRRLVALADVVVESNSPRVMKNFGLDYPHLRELKEDIIMVSLSGYGQQGPQANYVAFGTALEAASFSSITGYPGEAPSRTGVSFTDPISGVAAAAAVLLALDCRRRTGKGQFIDLAEREVGIVFTGEAIMDYTMNQRLTKPRGNRHPAWAPQGCYPCRGESTWIVMAVSSQEEWNSLYHALGDPPWCQEETFADPLSRCQHHDELDGYIAAWTREQDCHQAVDVLRQWGVNAAPVNTGREVMTDPHLEARGLFQKVSHPRVGARIYPRQLPPLFSGWAPAPLTPAPLLGEHNEEVLKGLLGMRDEDVAQLEAEKVIGVEQLVPHQGYPKGLDLSLLQEAGSLLSIDEEYRKQLGLDG
ncbi:MAG: CoA transferase [Chloroflexi bacterium]|nr:CoA transferase [Chloroflexota bacterium]